MEEKIWSNFADGEVSNGVNACGSGRLRPGHRGEGRRGTMSSIGHSVGNGKVWAGLAAVALGLVWLAPAMRADDAAPGTRAVRLSNVDGQVQVLRGGQVLADQAVENVPLFEGTRVVTGDDGRAEIQFEDGSMARLSPNSSLTLAVLRGKGGDGEAEIALETGLGY